MTDIVTTNGILQDFRRAAVFFGSGSETEKAGRAFAGTHQLNIIEKRELGKFANGEIKLEIKENIRGRDITYFAPDTGNVFDDMMETLITLDCLRRHGALKIAVFLPPALTDFTDPLLKDSPFEPEMFAQFMNMYEVTTLRNYKGKEVTFNLLPPVSIVREPASQTVVAYGHSAKAVAEEIAAGLALPLIDWRDNELSREAPANIILKASTAGNPNQGVLEAAAMIYKLRRKGAAIVNVVMELFHYARQERTDNRRVPLSVAVVGQILNYYRPNSIMTQDLHQAAIQNAGRETPIEPIYSTALIASKIAELVKKHNIDPSQILIGAVDRGAIGRATQLQRHLKDNHGIDILKDVPTVDKRHIEGVDGKVEVRSISHEDLVKGRILIFVDDMTDSGSTFERAAEAAKKAGASRVLGFVTHVVGADPVTGTPNIAKLDKENAKLDGLIALDTVMGLTPAMANLKRVDIMSNTQWLLSNIREWAWWLKSASEDASLKSLNDNAKPAAPALRRKVERYLGYLFKPQPV